MAKKKISKKSTVKKVQNTQKTDKQVKRTIIGLSMVAFTLFMLFLITATILISASLIYLYQLAKDDQVLTEDEVRTEIKAELKDVMLLPEEEPTFAKVTDITILQKENPGFYKDGRTGDYLVIYNDRAILYRFDERLIINIAPVKIEEEKAAPVVVDNESLKIDITNGTWTSGAAGRMKDEIGKLTYGNYSIETIATTTNKVSKTYVYDLTAGKKSPSVKKLAEQLKLEYKEGLPAGERADADVLIIVGSDRAN